MDTPETTTRLELSEVLKLLNENECIVTFKKIDGELREMPCTLIESFLPPAKKDDPLTQKKVREISDKVVSVWCTDKNQWRSFRLENLISITIKSNE